MNRLYTPFTCLLAAATAAALASQLSPTIAAEPAPEKAAVDRARDKVEMLDSIYKQTVVLITDKYVNDKDDFPAGSAAVALFAAVSKGGTHQVRLIDATGEPYEPANVAQDDFEREGLKRLKAGEATYEQLVQRDGVYQLRVVTPVPVVMQKCIMCHAHYAYVKKGEPIGAISYTMPID